jgi:hypothetical protein
MAGACRFLRLNSRSAVVRHSGVFLSRDLDGGIPRRRRSGQQPDGLKGSGSKLGWVQGEVCRVISTSGYRVSWRRIGIDCKRSSNGWKRVRGHGQSWVSSWFLEARSHNRSSPWGSVSRPAVPSEQTIPLCFGRRPLGCWVRSLNTQKKPTTASYVKIAAL